jgi:hypothetical protein
MAAAKAKRRNEFMMLDKRRIEKMGRMVEVQQE